MSIIWKEYKPRWWMADVDGKTVAAIRFESPEVNASRYPHLRHKEPIGKWISWVKTDTGSRQLAWDENTPLVTMQMDVEETDIRLLGLTAKQD